MHTYRIRDLLLFHKLQSQGCDLHLSTLTYCFFCFFFFFTEYFPALLQLPKLPKLPPPARENSLEMMFHIQEQSSIYKGKIPYGDESPEQGGREGVDGGWQQLFKKRLQLWLLHRCRTLFVLIKSILLRYVHLCATGSVRLVSWLEPS